MGSDSTGSFSLILHSHIPYVLSHGARPHGTDWLAEAVAESYLPLLNVCYRLLDEGISPKLTIGLSPILCEQLADRQFSQEFHGYLMQRIEAAQHDAADFSRNGNAEMERLARMWERCYEDRWCDFEQRYNSDLVGAFRRLQDEGHIEILTSAATHAYLPLLLTDQAVKAQVSIGVESYRRHFKREPSGFWLPECAYRPRYRWQAPVDEFRSPEPILRKGLDEIVGEAGLQYFLVDAHLFEGGRALGVYAERFKALEELWSQFARESAPATGPRSPYAPALVNSSGEPRKPVAVMARDQRTGIQVWSGEHGYPGDEWYLEFHKKHYPGNLRYWRISWPRDDLGKKQLYYPEMAATRIPMHAQHYADMVYHVLRENSKVADGPPALVAMYDAELFGHWWHEGGEWLYQMVKRLALNPQVERLTGSERLQRYPPRTVIELPEGSWGEGGYHWIWLNEWTSWTWQILYRTELKMQDITQKYYDQPRLATVLRQLGRELLLLQSSDWQFNISTWSARDYAEQRFRVHADRFDALADLIEKIAEGGEIEQSAWNTLGEAEDSDRCFPDLRVENWLPDTKDH